MNYSNYRFTLDIQSDLSQVSLPVRLGDTGRRLYINLTDGGNPYTISNGSRAVFFGSKADNNPILNNCIIEGNTTIRYDFTEQTANCAGIVDCEIRLYGPNGRLVTSPRFIMVVDERVIYGEEIPSSSSETTTLDDVLASEAQRKDAEAKRQESCATAVADANIAIENANTAAEIANNAAENANAVAELVAEQLESGMLNGADGKDGMDGEDYILTSADKTEIANIVLDSLPTWTGGSY